jgi:hypothetical protein
MATPLPWRENYQRVVPVEGQPGRFRRVPVTLVPGSEEDWAARRAHHGLVWPDGGPR